MTEKKFRKMLKVQICVSVALVLLGVVFFWQSMGMLQPESFGSGYQTGLSGGLIGAGIATFFVRLRILKNKDLFKREFVKQTDERTVAVSKTAMTHTFWISVVSIALAGFFGAFYSDIIAVVCSYIVCGMLLVYCISFWIANSRN